MIKGFFLLFILIFSVASATLASTSYYVSRSGDVLQINTNIPIFKHMKMNLVCNIFLVKIGMDRYIMVKDNIKPYTRKSLLGCQDYASSNIFDPLISLNSDNITEKITSEELKKANIRFVNYRGAFGILNTENKKNDLDIDRIAYIDLNNMRLYSNMSGNVYMYLKPKNEEQFSNNNKYMKELIIEIMPIPLSRADRLIGK